MFSMKVQIRHSVAEIEGVEDIPPNRNTSPSWGGLGFSYIFEKGGEHALFWKDETMEEAMELIEKYGTLIGPITPNYAKGAKNGTDR